MSVVKGQGKEPKVWERYQEIIERNDEEKAFQGFTELERQAFYERAKGAFAVVATGEKEQYSNIILKMGVVK